MPVGRSRREPWVPEPCDEVGRRPGPADRVDGQPAPQRPLDGGGVGHALPVGPAHAGRRPVSSATAVAASP